MKKATHAENRLINLCNHNISSDEKVLALRKYVNRQILAAMKKQHIENLCRQIAVIERETGA